MTEATGVEEEILRGLLESGGFRPTRGGNTVCAGPTGCRRLRCAVCERLSGRRAAQVHAVARGKSAILSADLLLLLGDSVRCKQSNLSRGGVVKRGAKDSTTYESKL